MESIRTKRGLNDAIRSSVASGETAPATNENFDEFLQQAFRLTGRERVLWPDADGGMVEDSGQLKALLAEETGGEY